MGKGDVQGRCLDRRLEVYFLELMAEAAGGAHNRDAPNWKQINGVCLRDPAPAPHE